jgi:hypothetical protein
MRTNKRWWAISLVLLVLFAVTGAFAAKQHNPGLFDELIAEKFAAFQSWYGWGGSSKTTYKLAFPTLTADDTAAGIAATQTLTNKTITSPALTTPTVTGDLTISPDATGGDNGTKSELSGLLRLKMVALGAGTNGTVSGKTLALIDDSPAGEFAAVDADTTCTTSTAHYRIGSASLKMAVLTTADAGDGCHDGVTANFTDDESMSFWVFSDSALTAGDLVVDLTDNGGHHTIDIPAVAANVWTYVDLTTDLTAIANGDKDTITDISLELSAAGAAKAATGAFNVWFDGGWKWDATENAALGTAILPGGVLGVMAIPTAAGTANTPTMLTENTDYFVHYVSGSDFIVWITDQSANSAVAFVNY